MEQSLAKKMNLDFAADNEYAAGSIYTDHDIYWGEMRKSGTTNEDGSGTIDFAGVANIYFPEKVRELGYKQAYIELFMGIYMETESFDKCKEYLGITNKQLGQLITLDDILKYRIFPGTSDRYLIDRGAKFFTEGYEKVCEEVRSKMGNDFEKARKGGMDMAMLSLKGRYSKELFEMYCEIYSDVV